ncbi:MAG: branched-chain amino acid ABC transporter permease [SAR324 cluster bacterium]|nr:branched-chain amino acid ABC transporter permease [SAR324 cluster bacterium]
MSTKNIFHLAALAALVILVQMGTAWTETGYYLTQLTMIAYYSLLIIGLCMLMGYAGQISLGHAGFFGIGGYISAALTSHNFAPYQSNPFVNFLISNGLLVGRTDLYGETLLSFHPWPACIIAISFTFITAFIIGIPVLKLKGHYLAMATLGFGIIIYRVVLATEAFGEADGLSEVPGFELLPGLVVSGDFDARIENYYIAWGFVLLGIVLLLNLTNSRVGRALRAIHGSEEAAQAMGVNTARYKLYIFVLSAVFAALAGVFLTHYNGGVGPSETGIMKSVRYVAIVSIGGMANIWGPLIMGVILNFMSLRGLLGSYDDVVFGVILILVMLFAPHGILRLNVWSRLRLFFFPTPAKSSPLKENQ